MRTRELYKGSQWTIIAVAGDRPDPEDDALPECAVVNFLKQCEMDHPAHRARLDALWQRLVLDKRGPGCLPLALSHEVGDATHSDGKETKIWEFVVGRIRLLYFTHGDRMVVCTVGYIKKGNKVDKLVKGEAIKLCVKYVQDQE